MVAAQEPLETALSFVHPVFVVRNSVGFEAGRARGLRAGVTWEPHLSKSAKDANVKILITSKDTPGLIVDVLIIPDLDAHLGLWAIAFELLWPKRTVDLARLAKAAMKL